MPSHSLGAAASITQEAYDDASGPAAHVANSKLHELITLAREPSSEKRRALLHEITNLFFTTPAQTTHTALFDDLLSQLADEMEEAVRIELSERMASAFHAPPTLLRKLAIDQISVAAPVLKRSPALTDADLIHVASVQGQDHLRAISQRRTLSQAVSDTIVDRGDDLTLSVLLSNDRAELSRGAHEIAVDRAKLNSQLHRVVVDRQSLPIDLRNEMYFVVEARLRERILRKNRLMDPAELEVALAAGRKRIATRDGALPADYETAEAAVEALKAGGPIGPEALVGLLRGRQTTPFLIAFAELTGVDFHTARWILDRQELDALAIVCKAAGFDRALFLTLAITFLGPSAGVMGKARAYGALYAELPLEAASRTVRFWRMRRQIGDIESA
jgi:uncharacterized protein (DUF2336 family)